MLFQQFWTWLSARLTTYVSVHAAATATAIEPAAIVAGTIYVMVWGYLHLRGRIDEPIVEGGVRLITLALVFGVGLRLWLYHAVIVDLFFSAPVELAAQLVGASNPVSLIDTIWERGGAAAGILWDKGSLLTGDFGFYVVAAAIYLLVGVLCVYAMFLIALSHIALAVLLALGPLFLVLTLFESTRKFFDAWLRQLLNYSLVSVLTILVAALLLDLVESFAVQTLALGSALKTVDALDLALVSGLVLLVLRQVLPIAAGLSGGSALSTFGLVSRGLGRGGDSVRSAASVGAALVTPARNELRPPVWRGATGVAAAGAT